MWSQFKSHMSKNYSHKKLDNLKKIRLLVVVACLFFLHRTSSDDTCMQPVSELCDVTQIKDMYLFAKVVNRNQCSVCGDVKKCIYLFCHAMSVDLTIK